MPFNLSFTLTLSAIMWFGYGLFLKDICIAVSIVLIIQQEFNHSSHVYTNNDDNFGSYCVASKCTWFCTGIDSDAALCHLPEWQQEG